LPAIENGEKILVYGDYDVDGTTAVALMYLYLSKIVEKIPGLLYPDRNSEGYGISTKELILPKKMVFH
jgi:single-stranded-DNA-specific exonuclease